jgi:thiamine pyrophosphate-dependent acetolactate synthase large subunit-like protein
MNAEELPVKALEAEGMDVAFGLPGEKNLHFVGAKYAARVRFRLIPSVW